MTRSASSLPARSKILSLALAALLLTPCGFAQTRTCRDADQLRKTVAKAGKKASKSSRAADWLRLAEVYEDAYRFPLSNITGGEGNSVRTLVVRGQRPREIMAPTTAEGVYRNIYSDKDICFDADGNLVAILVTRPVLDTVDVLGRTFDAYRKVYETDEKGLYRETVAKGFSRIATECRAMAEMSARFGRDNEAEQWYLRAARVSQTPPCAEPDPAALKVAAAIAAREEAARQEAARIEAIKASAWDILAKGEARYREGMALLDEAQALPVGDDKAFQALQERLTVCMREAKALLEQCEAVSDDPALRQRVTQALRPIRLYLGPEAN